MRLSSVRNLKRQLLHEAETDRVESILSLGYRPTAAKAAVGIAKGQRAGDYRLAIRTNDRIAAETLAQRAHGEADVRILDVKARSSPEYFNARRRPLEPGLAIHPSGRGWVGTLAGFVRDRDDVVYGLSNAHVLSDMGRVPEGTPISQPFGGEPVGVLGRSAPTRERHNLADAGLLRLRRVEVMTTFHVAVGSIAGVAEEPYQPDDLGRELLKAGRTTGVRKGRVTAVDIDNLPVDYGDGRLLWFDNQIEISGGPSTDFSAAGDSGSLIIDPATRLVVGLLFAGGRDSIGEDFTYANRIRDVLRALEVHFDMEPVL